MCDTPHLPAARSQVLPLRFSLPCMGEVVCDTARLPAAPLQVLPLRFSLPCMGEVVYLSKGLKYNLELLLFWGPGSPFENNWHLKDDYKRVGKRRQLSEELGRRALWVGVINLLLSPAVLLWQVLYSFYNYAEVRASVRL